jgi:hypothetical protein
MLVCKEVSDWPLCCYFLCRVRRLWSDLTEELQKLAKQLGYDEPSWDGPGAEKRILSGTLHLELENYLEPSPRFFFTQIVACVIMVVVVFSEVRHFVVAVMVARFLNADKNWMHKVVIYILAGFSYIAVPVFTLMGSILVILESGKELDVMKDAMALLFLIEINNFLQIATTEHSPRWKHMLRKKDLAKLDRAKNHFLLVASVVIIIFAFIVGFLLLDLEWAADRMVHQSELFNPMKDPHKAGIGMCFLFAFIFIFCVCVGILTSDVSFKECLPASTEEKQIQRSASEDASHHQVVVAAKPELMFHVSDPLHVSTVPTPQGFATQVTQDCWRLGKQY